MENIRRVYLMRNYINNLETNHIELHFEKSEYMALTDSQKTELKRAYLWSKTAGAWVSRSTSNHYWAIETAKKMGFTEEIRQGERLSYAEQLEVKSEKAERRAERYEQYSENAEKRAETLQAEFNILRKDWSWLTQPIIAGHSGSRAFANHRNRVMARYEKGFEEYQKSEYYQERAATARATADNVKLKDRVYLHNRIKEQNSKIKRLQESIVAYEENLYRLQQGEELKSYAGTLLTIEGQEKRIGELLEEYEYEYDKLEFFEKALDDLGGIQFSKDNIKVGFIVKMKTWGRCEILSAGPVNVTFKILDGGAAGGCLTEPYAAINEIVHAKEKTAKIENPFAVGDILCKYYGMESRNGVYKAFEVVKVTGTGVKIQPIAVEKGVPIVGKYIGEPMQKKVTKSNWSDFIGVYDGDWQLYKYEVKEAAGAV
jgi:hypothetical protein